MRYLVTGGTGFVGSHVIRACLARGHEVRAMIRETSPRTAIKGLPIETVVASLTSPEDCLKAAEGMDGILHVAGLYDASPGGDERMEAVHITATQTLADAALKAGVPRFLLCSSSITLPYGTRAAPAKEEDPDPFIDGCPYSGALFTYYDTKRRSEDLAFGYIDHGLEVVVVNPDYIIGAYDLKPTSGQLILQMAKSPWIPFYPPGGKSFIDAEDCGLGHVLAIEKGRSGERYFLGNENLSYREFMGIIALVVARPEPRYPLPESIGQALGKAGELLQPILPAHVHSLGSSLVESMFMGRYRSPLKARRELGLPATPILRSVEKAYAWFVDNDYLPHDVDPVLGPRGGRGGRDGQH